MLRTDRINVLPINDPIGVVVRGIDSSNVDSVFIAGKARKRNGQLLDVDLNRVRNLAYSSRDYVVEKAGFTMPTI
jgi:5-methylthioadenosine/S-adenosylhomocysteine deaminase